MTLITFTSIQNGNNADDALFNSRYSSIIDVINGNIDADNLANNAVTTAKIANDAVTAAKIPNNSITSAKIEVQQGWIAPSFQNGWVNYDATYNPCGYMKDSLGFVHLRGLVKNGTDGATIFTLPAGYRPQYRELLPGASADLYGRIDIPTDGQVIPSGGVTSPVWVCLDNLTFKAFA